MSTGELLTNLWQLLMQYGYFGIFIISFIGTASIIVPVPYTLIIFTLSLTGKWDPLLLTIAGGVGSALGEFSGYALGYFGRRMISKERQEKMTYLVRLFDRYGPLAIFAFALTPLPDDLLFIPLGILRYKVYKVFIPAIIGKTLMMLILVYFGDLFGDVLLSGFGEGGNIIGIVITTILLIIFIIALYRIDWERVLEKYVKKEANEEGKTKS